MGSKRPSQATSKRESKVTSKRVSKSPSIQNYESPTKKQQKSIDRNIYSKSKQKSLKKKNAKKYRNKKSSNLRNVTVEDLSRGRNRSSRHPDASIDSESKAYASSAVPQPRFHTNFPTNTNFTITLNNDEEGISEGSLEDE